MGAQLKPDFLAILKGDWSRCIMKPPSGCLTCASCHPVSGFPPASPLAVCRFHSRAVPGFRASAASGSPEVSQLPYHRFPGLPLFALTRAHACLQFSAWQISSINWSELAGLSDVCFTTDDSVPLRELSEASPLPVSGKASDCCSWFFCRLSSLSCTAYSSLSLSPLRRTVWAFSHRSRLGLAVAPPFGCGVPH
jgi:hypothetical protein